MNLTISISKTLTQIKLKIVTITLCLINDYDLFMTDLVTSVSKTLTR